MTIPWIVSKLETLSQKEVYIGAIALSLLLSVISYMLHPSVGNDGILYLRCAAAYDHSGFKAAMTVYPWPFYSVLIAGIHHLGLSYVNAGRLLDAVLQAWMICFFIRIILHFNPTPRLGFWALLCMISYGTLNDQRSLLLRDFGYWAFYLTALWLVLSFLRKEQRSYLWWFGLSTLLAALFRIEGVLIAMAMVILFFFVSSGSFMVRCRNSLIMAWPFWLGGLVFLLLGSHRLQDSGRLQDIYYALTTHGVSALLQSKQQAIHLMDAALSPHYKFILINQMYFSMLAGFFVYKLAMTTEVVFLGPALYGAWRKVLILTGREKVLLGGLIVFQTVILFLFLMNNLFLTSRYLLALSLLILLWTPFGFEKLYQQAIALSNRKWRVVMTAMIGVLFGYSLLNGFVHTGASKQYISNATHWLQRHMSTDDRLLVNNADILYHVEGAVSTWDEDLLLENEHVDCRQLVSYRYVAIQSSHHLDVAVAHCPNLRLEHSFRNDKSGVVSVYSVTH